MFKRRRTSSTVVLALLTVMAVPVMTDDVVVVRSGAFDFEAGTGLLDISGTKGFAFVASADISGGRFNAYSQCQLPECQPGTVVSLGAGWSGNDLPGDARFRGVTYANVGSLDGDSSATIEFSGSATMPPMSDEPVSITVPFEFSGSFGYGLNSSDPQQARLTGEGDATLLLQPGFDGTSWIVQRVVFEFDASPGS